MVRKIFLAVMIVFLYSCTENRESDVIPVNDFFKAPEKSNYHLSPDGKSISFLKLQGNTNNLFVEDVETGKSIQLTNLKEKTLVFYFWTGNNELVYFAQNESKDGKSDLFVINKDGSKQIQISSNENARIKVLEDQLLDNKYVIVASNKRDSSVFDAYRLNILNGKMSMIAKNPGDISQWMTDSNGMLKIAIKSNGIDKTLLFRDDERQDFRPVITFDFKTTLQPVAIAEGQRDVLYAISNVNRDKNALVAIDLKTGKEKKVLFGVDSLNVIDAKYSRVNKKVLFVTCETWKKEKFYLDEPTREKYSKIDQLFPKTEWRIMDKDKADNVFLIRTFTDRSPGSYYLFSAEQNELKKLADINPVIKEENMSEMKPISFRSSDGLTIHGYLTLPKSKSPKNLPVVVLPHSGPISRNVWGYNADVQFLANRGYAVLQVNYRGSIGYGKAFFTAGLKQWSDKIQEDVNDGVRWLINKKIANPKRVAIYGNGFGGYIALNCLYKNSDLYICGGSNSGVINLFSYLKTIPPYLKTDLERYYAILGNPITDTEFMRFASPVFHANRFKRPVFIAQNVKDPRVNVAEGVQFVKELKKKNVNVTYIEKEESPNPIKRQQGRLTLYKGLESFLQQNIGGN